MAPVSDSLLPEVSLNHALDLMESTHVDELPVLETADSSRIIGLLDKKRLRSVVNAEFLKRQGAA